MEDSGGKVERRGRITRKTAGGLKGVEGERGEDGEQPFKRLKWKECEGKVDCDVYSGVEWSGS